jgi:hypothetical protein
MSPHAIKYAGEIVSGNENAIARNHYPRRHSCRRIKTHAADVRNELSCPNSIEGNDTKRRSPQCCLLAARSAYLKIVSVVRYRTIDGMVRSGDRSDWATCPMDVDVGDVDVGDVDVGDAEVEVGAFG